MARTSARLLAAARARAFCRHKKRSGQNVMASLISQLIATTGLREGDLRRIISNAPKRYKVYYIAKRDGGRRKIAQPAKDVKFVQRALMDTLLSRLPIHDSATAYRKNISILDNAIPHAKSGPILKLDFKDFFPSIKSKDWKKYCRDFGILESSDDLYLSEKILFMKLRGEKELTLSVGAPSSPMLSNVIMKIFDDRVFEDVSKDKVIYTRYADDMTFSGPRTGHLINVKRQVSRIIRTIEYPNLDLNDEKTTYVTKKFHRTITGLTVANDGRITIGRDEKRRINAGVHNAANGTLSAEKMRALGGQLAYIQSVEPDFMQKLRVKYGGDTLKLIAQFSGRLNIDLKLKK